MNSSCSNIIDLAVAVVTIHQLNSIKMSAIWMNDASKLILADAATAIVFNKNPAIAPYIGTITGLYLAAIAAYFRRALAIAKSLITTSIFSAFTN